MTKRKNKQKKCRSFRAATRLGEEVLGMVFFNGLTLFFSSFFYKNFNDFFVLLQHLYKKLLFKTNFKKFIVFKNPETKRLFKAV